MGAEEGLISSRGGTYSARGRLDQVRTKLSLMNSRISDLESNVIFLLANPFLINCQPINISDQVQENQEHSDSDFMLSAYNPYSRWEPTFTVDSVDLHARLAECLGMKYSLMLEQKSLVEGLNEEEKKQGKDPREVMQNGSL